MEPIRSRITVQFDYQVHFTRQLFDPANPLLAEVARGHAGPARMLAVCDGGVLAAHPNLAQQIMAYARAHQDRISLVAPPLVASGGEAVKNHPEEMTRVLQAIHAGGICRHSYVLVVGGGAVLDMAGFAAATAHRGVRLIRVPTTVLAQDDSGVGIKNGINAFGKKNFVGAFAPPYAVLNDLAFLETLDIRDWRAGQAEAVKVALIKDATFFHYIREHAGCLAARDMAVMEALIHRCAELHMAHIAQGGDPFETGSARPLDFGHWAAHKLEQLTGYRLRHGEAVAIGVALDSTYSHLSGRLSHNALTQVLTTLKSLGFELWVPELTEHLDAPDHPCCIFQGLDEFREHLGGELTITLLQEIGCGVEVHAVDRALYRQAARMLEQQTGHSG